MVEIPVHPPGRLAQHLRVTTRCTKSGYDLEEELKAGKIAIRLTDEQSQSPLSLDGIWSTSMKNPASKQETKRYWERMRKECTDPQEGFFLRWENIESMMRHVEGGFTDWNPDDHASEWISLSVDFDWIIYQIAYRLFHRKRSYVIMSIIRLPDGDGHGSSLIVGNPVKAASKKGGDFRDRRGYKFSRRFAERLAYRRIPKSCIEQSMVFTAYVSSCARGPRIDHRYSLLASSPDDTRQVSQRPWTESGHQMGRRPLF
ncbi:hypothetical protein, variant [Cryptococcus amylolentus CBS 6039]|uniref:Uncharacterized protein n=1 Tax=Cryptococcus amylolentus CBS 6039 TaxID=1295533 RepID=A0A1E3HNJ9_9TREE|nr:hypothetical protein, variant [Cryptococcus amylolentus CBS 6039]ODN77715.1 hypothetical protein, variant [Cryptococcus amylolentus CBS 6039]